MLKNQYDYIDFYYMIYGLDAVSAYQTHYIKNITFQVK